MKPTLKEGGAPDTIRTCGLHLRRVALYPAELRVHRCFDSVRDQPRSIPEQEYSNRRHSCGSEGRPLPSFVLYNLLKVCFRGASATKRAIFTFPPTSTKPLVSIDILHTHNEAT